MSQGVEGDVKRKTRGMKAREVEGQGEEEGRR